MMTALAILAIFSCTKDSGKIDQTSIDLADDDAVSDAIFEDIWNTVDNASIIVDGFKGDDSKSVTVLADSCPVITITRPTQGLWPKTVTVDYGAACAGVFDNENTRSGKIIIVVTAPRLEKGSKRTVTFENYFFNGIKTEGTKVFENMGLNANQNVVISIKLTSGKMTLPNGKKIERSFDHQREWIKGILTRNIWDDECLVSGTASGVNINGVAYKNTIITPLHWSRACRFIVSGVVKIEREGVEPIEINYGTGDCDAKATVIRGTESREILLRNKHRSMFNN